MTQDKHNDEKAEDAPGRAEKADETPEPENGHDQAAKLRKEAAGYRRRLREAEAENEKLTARLSVVHRAEVERQVTGAGGLQSASDFWTAGVQLDDLRAEDGGIDPEKVKAERDRVLSEHPHWREATVSMDGGVREMAPAEPPSFGSAMKKAAGLG